MSKIIADLCANHMGDMVVAEKMIIQLASVDVDYVKVQSWQSDKLINGSEEDMEYYKSVELSDDDHLRIKDICDANGIGLICTCFDLERVNFIASLGTKLVKVASPDFCSNRLLNQLIWKFDELIVSSAGADKYEYESIINEYADANVTFMHCNPYYPTPLNKVDMNKIIKGFAKDPRIRFGYSDHTLGIEAAQYAICLGSKYIEKHFTLERSNPGRDQAMSSTIYDFRDIVNWRDKVRVMQGSELYTVNEHIDAYREKYIGRWGNNN